MVSLRQHSGSRGIHTEEAGVRMVRVVVTGVFLLGLGATCAENAQESGTGGAGGTPPFDGSGDTEAASCVVDPDAASCAAEQAALIAFVKANKGCTTDADCVFVPVRSIVREVCPSPNEFADAGGGFYLNATHDQAELDKLAKTLDACLPPPPPITCGISPSTATCWHGQCDGTFDIGSKAKCLSDLGGESACVKCACGMCNASCQGVVVLPIVLCAMKAGCLGTPKCDPKCDPGSPDFPCKEVMTETGSGFYDACNRCIADWQCTPDCAAGKAP